MISEDKIGKGYYANTINVNDGLIVGVTSNYRGENYSKMVTTNWHLSDVVYHQLQLVLKQAAKGFSQFDLKSWSDMNVANEVTKAVAERLLPQGEIQRIFQAGNENFDALARTPLAKSKFYLLKDHPEVFGDKQATSITVKRVFEREGKKLDHEEIDINYTIGEKLEFIKDGITEHNNRYRQGEQDYQPCLSWEDASTSWSKDDTTSTSWSKDDTTSTSWSKDDTTSTSWSKNDTTSTSWSKMIHHLHFVVKDDTTSTSWSKDDTTSTSWSKDDTTSTSWSKDDTTSTSWSKDDTTSTSWSKDDTTSTSWSKDDATSTLKSRKLRKYKVNEMFKKVVSRLKSDGKRRYSLNVDSSKEHSFASFKSLKGFWNLLTNRRNRNGEVRNENTSGIGEVGRDMFDQSDFSEERDQPHDELRKLVIDILENHLLERGFGELAAKEQWQFDVKGINKGELHVFSKDMANKDTTYYITYRDKERVLNTTYKECEVDEALLQILKDQIGKIEKAGKVVRGSSGSLSLALGPIHLELPRVNVMRMQEDNESPQLFFTDNKDFFDPNNPLSTNMRGNGWKHILPEKLITSSLIDKFQNDIDGWISTIVREHCPNLEEPEQEKFARDIKKYLKDEKVFLYQNKSEKYFKMVEKLIVSRVKTKNEEAKKAKENMAEQTQSNDTTH